MEFASRVKETSTTTGTGTLDLGGAVDGKFQTFVSGVGGGAAVYYVIVHQGADEWETGIGTVTDGSPDTLSRDTVLESSNSGSAVNFSSGTKHVFIDIVGEHAPGDLLIASGDADPGSPVASFDFDLPDTFDAYELRWFHIQAQNAGASSGVHKPALRFSTDGGSSFDSGTNYDYAAEDTGGTGVDHLPLTGSENIGFNDDVADSQGAGRLLISNAHQTGEKTFVTFTGGTEDRDAMHDQYGSGVYTVTTGAVDAVRFFVINSDMSGHVRVYGVR